MSYMFIDKDAIVADMKSGVIEVIYDLSEDVKDRRVSLFSYQPYHMPYKFSHAELDDRLKKAPPGMLPVWELQSGWKLLPLDKVLSCQITNR